MEEKLDLFLKELAELTEKYGIDRCPLVNEHGCLIISDENVLDLIIRQQERIEELEIITGLADNRKYYRKFVDEVFCKQKGNELSEPDFDYIYQLYFEQQAEIERLQSLCTSKDVIVKAQEAEIERLNGNLFTISNACMQRRNEAIKEFAERLKDYVKTQCNPYGKPIFDYDTSIKILKYIESLLAEMVGEDDTN